MSKEKDYLDKIEVHRQEVELDEVGRRRTRTRSSQKQNKASKSPMMKFLVVIFILIPLGLLGYVWLFYEPEVEKAAPVEDSSLVHIEKNNSPAASPSEDEDEDKDESNQNGEGQDSSNSSSNDVEIDEEEEKAIAKAAAEAEKKLKEQQSKDDEENEQSSNPNAKTHVVEAKDTLFSIAMKYYKDPTKVDAIKKANNLTSDSIPLGKELILP